MNSKSVAATRNEHREVHIQLKYYISIKVTVDNIQSKRILHGKPNSNHLRSVVHEFQSWVPDIMDQDGRVANDLCDDL